jgi:hypothetical protein
MPVELPAPRNISPLIRVLNILIDIHNNIYNNHYSFRQEDGQHF